MHGRQILLKCSEFGPWHVFVDIMNKNGVTRLILAEITKSREGGGGAATLLYFRNISKSLFYDACTKIIGRQVRFFSFGMG